MTPETTIRSIAMWTPIFYLSIPLLSSSPLLSDFTPVPTTRTTAGKMAHKRAQNDQAQNLTA